MSSTNTVWRDRYEGCIVYIDRIPEVDQPIARCKDSTIYVHENPKNSYLTISLPLEDAIEEFRRIAFYLNLTPEKYQNFLQLNRMKMHDDGYFMDVDIGQGRLIGGTSDGSHSGRHSIWLYLAEDDWVEDKPDAFLDFLIEFWLA